MTLYEFTAMSAVMCVDTDDPKIATACALWWAPTVPAACKDESVSPLHLFGFLNDAALPKMDEYFDGSLEDFFEKRKPDIETCISNSLYPFGQDKLEEMFRYLSFISKDHQREFTELFIEKNGTY